MSGERCEQTNNTRKLAFPQRPSSLPSSKNTHPPSLLFLPLLHLPPPTLAHHTLLTSCQVKPTSTSFHSSSPCRHISHHNNHANAAMPPFAPPMPQPQHLQQQAQNSQHPQQNGPFYPSLYLYPLNDSFVPKQISLAPQNGRVKIGRQTNAKTVPGERNGYFDSKVLSRQHAEIWEEGGKVRRSPSLSCRLTSGSSFFSRLTFPPSSRPFRRYSSKTSSLPMELLSTANDYHKKV